MQLLKNYEINALPASEARALYRNLKKTALKRMKRLTRNGRDIYLDHIPDFTPASKLNDDAIYGELKEINAFLKNPFTKMRYINKFEKEMIQKLNESGYDFVNKSNIAKVIYMLGKMRDETDSKYWDSDEALEMVEQFERLNISVEDFKENYDTYMQHDPEELKKIKPIRTGREMNIKDLEKRIKNMENKNDRKTK